MSIASTTPGFSATAHYVEEAADEGFRPLQESTALGIESVVCHELASVWEECRNPNWDGYGALPVTRETLRNAYCLLESLPLGFPAPSIGAEPDGHLTLEWHCSSRRTLSVSVSPEGELHYAGLFGPNRAYGTEVFFGELPASILELVWRVYA
jgi:hypothetical protein